MCHTYWRQGVLQDLIELFRVEVVLAGGVLAEQSFGYQVDEAPLRVLFAEKTLLLDDFALVEVRQLATLALVEGSGRVAYLLIHFLLSGLFRCNSTLSTSSPRKLTKTVARRAWSSILSTD